MSIREPAVAGMFYKAGASELKEQVESCFLNPAGPRSLPRVNPKGPRKIVGLICPHAGLMYSGSIAAWAYHRLAQDGLPEIAILVGPNHRSYFPAVALSNEKIWRTPMGEVELDTGIAEDIVSKCAAAKIKSTAHFAEHSLEVQLPFLQHMASSADAAIRIVPIIVGASARFNSVEIARQLGNAIAAAVKGKNAVVIASTDFTHYEHSEVARSKDSSAIARIAAMDEEGLLHTAESLAISMCGALPTAATIMACKKLGAASAKQLAYGNSGDITGDYTEVVGYAALEMRK